MDDSTRSRRRPHPALHLLWTIPIALVVGGYMTVLSLLNWCGVSGCSGGGFGRISNPDVPAAVALLVGAGVVAALPLALVPWTPRRGFRLLVTVLFAALACLVGYLWIGP